MQTLDNIDPDYLWKDYTYFSGHTPKIIEHFRTFVDDLTHNYQFDKDASVLDIGSNDGSLLLQFKDKGFDVEGIDPAETVVSVARSKNIKTHLSLFDSNAVEKYFHEAQFDVITAFNVFAHSPSIREMAKSVSFILKPNGIFCFEVQYLLDIVQKRILGTFFHEHMVHYSLSSASHLVKEYGLEIVDFRRNNIQNGSIIFICQKISSDAATRTKVLTNESKLNALMSVENHAGILSNSWGSYFFEDIINIRKKVANLVQRVSPNDEIRFAGYGAARSGPTLAIQYGFEQYLTCLFDDHPAKVGLYAPLRGLKVLPTSELSANEYRYVFILAYIHYKPIIRNSIEYLTQGGHLYWYARICCHKSR